MKPGVDCWGKVGAEGAGGSEAPHDDAGVDYAHGFALERRSPSERLIDHDGERPEIAAEVDLTRARDLLWAHIVRRSEPRAGLGEARLALDLPFGDAEVEQVDEGTRVCLGDEQVGRLDVAVNDVELVGSAEA